MKYEPKSALKHISKSTARSIDAVDRVSDIQLTLNHAVTALSNEVKKLRSKSFLSDLPLSVNDLKMLNESIRVLVACEKQQLESMKTEELTAKLSEMSDADLLEYAKSIMDSKRPQTLDAHSTELTPDKIK